MKLRTDLAATKETVLVESGIDISPVRSRVPEELKSEVEMAKLLDQCMAEAYSDFSDAMMGLINEQNEQDVENDFRKFKP